MNKEKYAQESLVNLEKCRETSTLDMSQPENWPALKKGLTTLIEDMDDLHEVYASENSPKGKKAQS